MNYHTKNQNERQSLDNRPDLREQIADAQWSAAHYSNMAQEFAALDDDAGLAYALRKQVAYVKFAIAAFNELIAANKTFANSEDR